MSRLTITDDDILEQTEGGKTIFEKVLGEIPHKCISSPLRADLNPSFSVFLANNGLWMYKDFSNGDSGSAITFISKLHNITYLEAVDYIKGLKIEFNTTKPVIKEKKEPLIVDWVTMPFQQMHRDYWDQYFLPESFLNENGVFALKMYAVQKKIIPLHPTTAAFVYEHPSGGCKILQIGDNITRKWTNTVKNNELWGFPTGKCKQLWVQKSVKDMLVSKYHFQFCTTAIQSETHTIIDDNIDKLKTVSDDIVLFWGNDPQSVKECTIAQQKYNLKYFNIPKYMYKNGVVDLADCVASYGINRVEKELKKKGFL